MVQINFLNDNKTIKSESTASLLDISLQNGIPHVHVCGGKARCSTCRVIVLDGEENVLPRNEAEEKLARKKGFECNIRLACQTRVKGDVTVRRLVMDDEDIYLAAKHHGSTTGKEQQLAVLFSDIRSFTSFSETNLAYDVIHMLNRYFYEIGEVILQYDGFIDKYMGDGIMVLFGLEENNPQIICLNAVKAALAMLQALDRINHYFSDQFDVTFHIGIGIHFGEVIVGEIGHPKNSQFTAIGDVVNTASRIESATKEFQTPLLISRAVTEHVKNTMQLGRLFSASLKGKAQVLELYEVTGGKDE